MLFGDEDVLGLHVAVQDADLATRAGEVMRAFERASHRRQEAQGLFQAQRRLETPTPLFDPPVESLTFEPFEGDEGHESTRALERADVERSHHGRRRAESRK